MALRHLNWCSEAHEAMKDDAMFVDIFVPTVGHTLVAQSVH